MLVDGIVQEVRDRLAGTGLYQDSSTELAADLTADFIDPETGEPVSRQIHVTDTTAIGPGIVEIDYERIRVRNSEETVLNVYTFGRGYAGSEPAIHTAGAEVRVDPTFPSSAILRELRAGILDLYPAVYAVKSFEGFYDVPVVESDEEDEEPVTTTYPVPFKMPDEAAGIVSVYVMDALIDKWIQQEVWRWDPMAGNGLEIPFARKNDLVRVVYAAAPTDEIEAFDDFETVTGLSSNAKEILSVGIAAKFLTYFATARAPRNAAEARLDAQSAPASLPAQVARQLQQQYQERLAQEQFRLRQDYPIRVHREVPRFGN
jgi:hypothetical protein